MPQVLNKKKDKLSPGAVYIGRPSKWGNPFIVGKHGTREQVIQKYASHIGTMVSEGLIDISELRGKGLVCWCSPLPCHGDILLKLANKGDGMSRSGLDALREAGYRVSPAR